MKAIILAAGAGTRLLPMTDNKPKTLIDVNGKPILQYIIQSLINNDVTDIILCVGYMNTCITEYCNAAFPDLDITYVYNENYKSTNNLYTLYLTREYMNETFLLMNADIILEPEIIKKLLNVDCSAFCIDKGVFNLESMKVTTDEEGYINAISKEIPKKEAYGTSIDVYKFMEDTGRVLKSALINAIEKDNRCNDWSETLFNNLLEDGIVRVRPLNINGLMWYEIDNHEDLKHAESLFR